MTDTRPLEKFTKQIDKIGKEIQKIRKSASEDKSEGDKPVASNRTRIFIGTFLVIILIGIAYFYLYTERIGDRIDERRFRMLTGIENHIRQKETGYLQAVESINFETVLTQLLTEDPEKSVVTSNDLLQANIDNPVAANLILFRDSIGNDIPDQYFLMDIPLVINGAVTQSVKSDTVTFKLYVKLSSFVSELVPEGIFDHIIVLENEAGKSLRSLYQSLTNRVVFEGNTLDSLFTSSSGFRTGGIKEMIIDGKKYRMYVHVSGNEQLSISKHKVICGLIQNSSYQALKRQVNIWLVVILSIIAIVAIICIPLLKIVLINDFEQIQTSDVVLSGLSLILGAPLVLLIFFSVFEYASYFFYDQPAHLKKFGKEVEKAVYYEVAAGLKQLDYLEKHHEKLPEIGASGVKELRTQQYPDDSCFTSFNEYYGLDEYGRITFAYYSYGGDININLNLSERKYFQDLQAGNLLLYNPKVQDSFLPVGSNLRNIPGVDSLKGFVMEAVTSWTTGKKELIIAVEKTRNVGPPCTKYLAISIPASKLNSAILRPGFGFIVFDAGGNTMFNSNSQRTGSENFLKEIDSQDVMSAVNGHQEIVTRTEYWENRIRLHIKPSTQWPLYFGTYYDLSHSRSFIAEISSMSLFFVIIATILMGLVALVSSLLRNRDRRKGFREFAFEWLRPRDGKKSKRIYYLSLFYMLLIGIMFVVIASKCVQDPKSLWEKSAILVSMGLITPSLVYFSNYWINEIRYNKEELEDARFSEFLGNPVQRRIAIFFAQLSLFLFYIWVLGHFISDLSWFLAYVGSGFFILFIILGIIVKLALSKTTLGERIDDGIEYTEKGFEEMIPATDNSLYEDKITKETINRWYIRYLMMWLVVSSLIPLILIFSLSKNTEEILYLKYEALNVAAKMDGLLTADRSSEKLTENYFIEKDSLLYMNKLTFDLIRYPDQDGKIDGRSVRDSLSADRWRNLLFRIRPVFPEMLQGLSVTIRDGNKSDRWFWEIEKNGDMSIFYRTMVLPDTVINISTNLDKIKDKPITHGLSLGKIDLLTWPFFISSVIIFIFLLTGIIKYATSTIFGLKFKSVGSIKMNWKELEKSLATPSDHILICNSELSKQIVRKKIGEDDYSITDIQKLYHILSIEKNKTKQLEEIKNEFIDNSKYKLVLIDKYPSYFFAELEKDKVLDKNIIEALKLRVDHMEQVLFNEVLHDLNGEENHEQVDQISERPDEDYIEKKKNFSYYGQLWSSASNREKYILYDLARDLIANTKNDDTVNNLCYKGYIYWDEESERLELYDNGFQTYINTTVQNNEGPKLEKEKRDRGTWSYLRFIIIGIIVAVIAFVSLGNPDFFKDFNGLLGLVASAVTLYPIIGSLFTVRN